MSVYAKAGEYSKFLLLTNNRGSNEAIGFDLSDASTFVNDLGYATPSADAVSIEAVGNGWYRCSMKYAKDSTGGSGNGIYLVNDAEQTTFVGNDSDGIYFWGWQMEAGSYQTSYIPTYGTSVTRNEEIFKTQDIQTNGLITPTAWTLFFNCNVTLDTQNQYRDLFAIYGSKSFRVETRVNGQIRSQQSGMVVSGDNFNAQTIGTTSNTKFAITFTPSQVKIYVDGALVGTYNGVYEHDFNVLNVRNSNTLGAEVQLKYKKAMLFPTALTEQEAIDLTTI